MSAIPGVRNLFEEYRKAEGGKRVPQMLLANYHNEGKPYVYTAGSTFKSIIDFADPTSASFSSEVDNDQSVIF